MFGNTGETKMHIEKAHCEGGGGCRKEVMGSANSEIGKFLSSTF